MRNTKPSLSHEELIKQLKNKGWQFITSDSSKPPYSGTLEDVVKASHAHRKNSQEPGLIKQLENEVELDLIQLEKLWQYLGLPN